MKRQRRKHSPEFKAKVALEAIKGIKTLSEISKEYEVHPVMVSAWKKDMMERLPEVFEKKNTKKDKRIRLLNPTNDIIQGNIL
ncbi:MAG: transposase, partial [Desulfobulbaceae bacterium]|nr:transposase [Desulfobulbaceae bacterium]